MNKEKLQKLLENIGKSRCVIGEAIDGRSDAIAYGIGLFGKAVTPRWIRSLNEPGEHKRYAFQENYKRMIGGWLYGCRTGAELLWNDLELYWRQAQRSFQISSRPMLSDAASLKDLILIKNRIEGMLAEAI